MSAVEKTPADAPTEASARDQLLRLEVAVEASGEVIFMTDAAGVISYVNPEFVRVYGYQPEEVVGHATPRVLKSDLTPPEEYAAFWRQLRDCKVVRREFVNRTKSGQTVVMESCANPVVAGGELIGFLAIQRDVTTRKATEAALRESEARYRTLTEAAHDSIFIVDRDARIEYANAMGCRRFNKDGGCGEFIGKRLQNVFDAEPAAKIWNELSVVFASGRRHYFESTLDSADGQVWLGTWVMPMFRDGPLNHDVAAVMCVARDITDRKHLEREFAQAQKMEAIGRLAGGIAHDFNNLLTAILGYSELLHEGLRHDAKLAADLYEIRRAGERASALTRQLLTFSRKQAFSPRVLDLNELVLELEKMLRRVIGEDVILDIVTEATLRPIKADSSQLEQLVMNLVVNARDAMPCGGTLRVVTADVELDEAFVRRHPGSVAGSYVALSVADTGSGMTPDVASHIFEPFFTTKPPGKGTGLGLSTVYGIVKQSGGYITVESVPGSGTTFTTYLPVASEPPERSAGVTAIEPARGTQTLLVVEDAPGLLRLMQRTLEQQGYTVLSANSIADALDFAERYDSPIDLLLTDVVMPVLNGPDLAQRIVNLRPAIKVLYVSGFTDYTTLRADGVNGRTWFMEKPFTPHALAAKVRECLVPHG